MKPNSFNTRERTIQKRGQLTDRVKNLSKELLNYTITVTELRLMVYIFDRSMNGHKIEIKCINRIEEKILVKWFKNKWLSGGYENFRVNKDFWEKMSQIIYLSYVDLY